MKILIIDDDRSVSETLNSGLKSAGHTVEVANDGNEGSFMSRSFDYDMIILDYSMPKKDGLSVCREIRALGKTTPIIFLSVTDDPDIKIAAFDSGADDYMTKPFALQELMARLKLLSRRPGKAGVPSLQVHDLKIDAERSVVMRGNRRLKITRKEFCLLEYMVKHAGTVLSRALIMEHVWTADSNPFSNTVEAHIRNLRKKLNVGRKPSLIANIPGRGYVIDTPQNLRDTYGL
jgi:two-component system OmpR family response regulator